MAVGTLKFELCAPDQELVAMDILDATIPGEDGVFTVYPGHTPYLSTLIPGVLVARDMANEDHHFAVHGGFAEVKNDTVIILADNFEFQDDIDQERAQLAKERAEELLRRPPENINWPQVEGALARAIARLRASNRRGYH